MHNIDNLVNQIREAEKIYKPNEAVQAHLQSIILVPLIGPFAVGKTTIMQTAEKLNPTQFGYVRGFTTREQRDVLDAETYDFLPHDEPTLERLLADIAAGELVNFVVHPTTGRVYGTRLDHYKTPFALLDALPQSLPELERLPFKAVYKVAVVTPPKEWASRVEERLQIEPRDDIARRLQEGASNVEWLLANKDTLLWLNNGGRSPEHVTQQLMQMLANPQTSDPNTIEIAEHLLDYIQKIDI